MATTNTDLADLTAKSLLNIDNLPLCNKNEKAERRKNVLGAFLLLRDLPGDNFSKNSQLDEIFKQLLHKMNIAAGNQYAKPLNSHQLLAMTKQAKDVIENNGGFSVTKHPLLADLSGMPPKIGAWTNVDTPANTDSNQDTNKLLNQYKNRLKAMPGFPKPKPGAPRPIFRPTPYPNTRLR